MTKPDFFSLPGEIQENMLWDMDLDYDAYESSMAEEIHSITCNMDGGYRNTDVIKEYYAKISAEDLTKILKDHIESLKNRIEHWQKMLDS